LVKKQELESKINAQGFWDDQQKARQIQAELKYITSDIERYNKIKKEFEDTEILYQLLLEEKDEKLENELVGNLNKLNKDISNLEINLMFSGPYDRNNAIVTIHSGAGGTEACDWVQMLLRMYLMWAEKKGFKANITDILPGDEAGIKSVTIEVEGEYAYGNFRAEKGVHRLVRISPFDANKRRHTSFASLDVIPEIEEEIKIEIKPEDLKIDTYRASGAGGQHVNKTESAVRITHIPTGIVVACQKERSQIKNREIAMKILKAKIFALQEMQKKEELDKIAGEKKSIGWGSQIRSYVFHPYKMIKDLRTDVERYDVDKVMDGDLDNFVEAFLKMELKNNAAT